MLGKKWWQAVDGNGARRLNFTGDYLRREIEEAFRQKKQILPVLLDDAQMPEPAELPELPDSIAPLAALNAQFVHTNEYFDFDISRLMEWIDVRIAERDRRLAEAHEIERQQRFAAEETAGKERQELARAQRETEAREAAATKISQQSLEKTRPDAAGNSETAKIPTDSPANPAALAKPKSWRSRLETAGAIVWIPIVCAFGILFVVAWAALIWGGASWASEHAIRYLNDSLRSPLTAQTAGTVTFVLTILIALTAAWILIRKLLRG
jgi:hypothetical protein